MVLESQCMLKMSSSGSNTGVQTLSPLVNCIVNWPVLHALLHVSPHVNQTSLQVPHILDFCLVDTLLHYAPDFVVNWDWVWAVWRPQIWRDKRRCIRRLIVSRALCASALSCWKQLLNINISHGSVVTHLTWGKMFHNDFIANLQLSLSVKEFWKSVNIWRSYRQKYSGMFFWLTVYNCVSSVGNSAVLHSEEFLCYRPKPYKAVYHK